MLVYTVYNKYTMRNNWNLYGRMMKAFLANLSAIDSEAFLPSKQAAIEKYQELFFQLFNHNSIATSESLSERIKVDDCAQSAYPFIVEAFNDASLRTIRG